jgi:hypothetical protein
MRREAVTFNKKSWDSSTPSAAALDWCLVVYTFTKKMLTRTRRAGVYIHKG